MFKYKLSRPPHKPLPYGEPLGKQQQDEVLSGMVQGAKSSDIEERFARALTKEKTIDGYSFRYPVISPRHMPGQLEIDFVVQSGGYIYPFQIDGEIAHKGVGKRQDDARKDILVNQYMKKFSAFPVKRIEGELLSTQEQADRVVRELIR